MKHKIIIFLTLIIIATPSFAQEPLGLPKQNKNDNKSDNSVYLCEAKDKVDIFRDYPCPLGYKQLKFSPDESIDLSDDEKKEPKNNLQTKFITTTTQNEIICPIIKQSLKECKVPEDVSQILNQECSIKGASTLDNVEKDIDPSIQACVFTKISGLANQIK